MRTLLVMRHAKSDWDADYGRDHERPLNQRGVRNARQMGKVLLEEELVPALVITSTALRARSTAELANDAGDWDADIVVDPNLYGTDADTAIRVASDAPELERLMLVGHQPTWSTLVEVLTGEQVEMKTATVAVVEFDIDEWRGLAMRRGRLVAVFHPRS